jgi:hypothetical protein
MKSRIMMAGYGFDDDTGGESTLRAHGICRPLNDWVEGVVGRNPIYWPVVAWKDATCPPSCNAGQHNLPVVTPEQPLGLFRPRDLDAKQIGSNRYDKVLRAAESVKGLVK